MIILITQYYIGDLQMIVQVVSAFYLLDVTIVNRDTGLDELVLLGLGSKY